MKTFKKLCAFILVLAILFSFAGCHKKGEIAVTVDGTEFTSGYYMCALIFSDLQAQEIVHEQLGDETQVDTEIDYKKEKIDGKKYATWVKDNTITTLKITALMKKLCSEADLSLAEDVTANAEYTADFYWDSYGYSEIFGNNGVSKETFKQYMVDSYYKDTYFEHIYGEEGENAISTDATKQVLQEKFYLANILEVDLSQLDDAAVLASQDNLRSYEDMLRNNEISFKAAYSTLNGDTEGIEASTDSTENLPQDTLATIVGDEDTNYSSIYYSDLAEMELGEVKYVDKTDDLKIAVLIKKDITEDPFYLESLDSYLRQLIAGDNFESEMTKKAEDLKAEINDYAVNAFKVDKIVYPEYTS